VKRSDADRRLLLRIARESITAHLCRTPAPDVPGDGAAGEPGAAFVTLIASGRLRGCIGHLEAEDPLGRVIARCAVAAATSDPRFPALGAAELTVVAIELSLLGPLQSVSTPEEIEVGRHGVVVEMGWRRGLLLPQVAVEWQWDREVFLSQTCRKAGLANDAWKRGARLWRFEAEVFGEQDSLLGSEP